MPKCCGGQSAPLATITSEAENSFIFDKLFAPSKLGTAFIGLDDLDNVGQCQWVTHGPVTFRQNEVSSCEAGVCAVMISPDDSGARGAWSATSCTDLPRFAVYEYNCELPAVRIATKATDGTRA